MEGKGKKNLLQCTIHALIDDPASPLPLLVQSTGHTKVNLRTIRQHLHTLSFSLPLIHE